MFEVEVVGKEMQRKDWGITEQNDTIGNGRKDSVLCVGVYVCVCDAFGQVLV